MKKSKARFPLFQLKAAAITVPAIGAFHHAYDFPIYARFKIL